MSNWGEHGVGPDPRAEAGFNGEPGFRVDPERLLLAARAAASIAQAVGELDRRLAATAVSVASAGLPGAAALIELLGDERRRMAGIAQRVEHGAQRLEQTAARYMHTEADVVRSAFKAVFG